MGMVSIYKYFQTLIKLQLTHQFGGQHLWPTLDALRHHLPFNSGSSLAKIVEQHAIKK